MSTQRMEGTEARLRETNLSERDEYLRRQVRERYGAMARSEAGCSCGQTESGGCCGGRTASEATESAKRLGYDLSDLAADCSEANLGLGCGNPKAIAGLKPGETVLDLGSGAGFDCFLAARAVGRAGRVFGVDMTPEMIAKARAIARKRGFTNVEFRLGEIEHLPVRDESVNVVISNCVINLSPAKEQVFREAFRVLKAGGRLAIADIVAIDDIPAEVDADIANYTGCISGAARDTVLRKLIEDAGFLEIVFDTRELQLDEAGTGRPTRPSWHRRSSRRESRNKSLEPGTLNPFVVRALLEKNVDIRDKRPQSVFDLWKSGRVYHYVITVCDREAEEQCPVFPGLVVRRSWPFRDPAKFAGSESEIMDQVREVREQIRKRVIAFIGEFVPVAELTNEYRE